MARGIGKRGMAKVRRTFREFKAGTLHSGSKKGPTVRSRKQAIAIALSQGRKASRVRRGK
jgi:hypothetical protein